MFDLNFFVNAICLTPNNWFFCVCWGVIKHSFIHSFIYSFMLLLSGIELYQYIFFNNFVSE